MHTDALRLVTLHPTVIERYETTTPSLTRCRERHVASVTMRILLDTPLAALFHFIFESKEEEMILISHGLELLNYC